MKKKKQGQQDVQSEVTVNWYFGAGFNNSFPELHTRKKNWASDLSLEWKSAKQMMEDNSRWNVYLLWYYHSLLVSELEANKLHDALTFTLTDLKKKKKEIIIKCSVLK